MVDHAPDQYGVASVEAVPRRGDDPVLDAICVTASGLFEVRYAAIGQHDTASRWYLAGPGLESYPALRDAALCCFTLRGERLQPLVILNTLEDPRSATNPLVIDAPHLRFYVGIPISLGGMTNDATLCIADDKPRSTFSLEHLRRLTDLALFVEATFRARYAEKEMRKVGASGGKSRATLRAQAASRLQSHRKAAQQERVLLEIQDVERLAEATAGLGRWSMDLVAGTIVQSKGMARLFGREDLAERVMPLKEYIACFHPSERASVRASLRRVAQGRASGAGGGFIRRRRILRPEGTMREILVHGQSVYDPTGRAIAARGIALEVTELTRAENQLRSSETLLRVTLESMDQGLLMTDAQDRVRVYNRRAAAMLEMPDTLLTDGVSFDQIRAYQTQRGEFAHLPDELRRWLECGDPDVRTYDYERTRPDGTVLQVRTLPLPEGGLVRTFTDVTERRAAELAVQESERRFRLLAENASDIIVLGDLDMRRVYVSPAVRTVLGYEPEEFIARKPQAFVHPDDLHLVADGWLDLLRGQTDTVVACTRYRHKAGHYVWIEASARLAQGVIDGPTIGYVATLRDITARREAEEQIRYSALHDALTGLPNRTLFRDRLGQALVHASRRGKPLAVLACDLDRFKAVNDSFGHPAGDTLLRVVAERMQAILSPYDTLARLGGDEFAIVLTDFHGLCAAETMARRLIAVVGEPIDLDGHRVEVGVTIGLALPTEHSMNVDELFKGADIALYEAKDAGRNTYRVFKPESGARICTRGQLSLDMREAIRRGEFRLVYQPVIDAATGSIAAFEALMRWHHPTGGEIPPNAFIALAEENGSIVPLGDWALLEACRQAIHWPAHICIAVNVSAIQLRHEGLVAAIRGALATSGLPGERLILEVTESVLMQDADDALIHLHRLRDLGLRIALDDFGTGYSSLSYLRRFAFDTIKIDRSFIRDIADPDTAAIVRAVVGLSDRLGMGIVAEGVETAEQLDLVRREGCTHVQGFLYSRPLPPADIAAFIVTRPTSAG